jgi:hypothetical protein
MSAKFRPSLDENEIRLLLDLCKSNGSQLSLAIARKLIVFLTKLDNGIITSAYSLKPVSKQSLSSDLGFTEVMENLSEVLQTEQAERNGRLKAAFTKWIGNPASCSLREISDARQWRYENDLMNPQEQAEFEKEVFGL